MFFFWISHSPRLFCRCELHLWPAIILEQKMVKVLTKWQIISVCNKWTNTLNVTWVKMWKLHLNVLRRRILILHQAKKLRVMLGKGETVGGGVYGWVQCEVGGKGVKGSGFSLFVEYLLPKSRQHPRRNVTPWGCGKCVFLNYSIM